MVNKCLCFLLVANDKKAKKNDVGRLTAEKKDGRKDKKSAYVRQHTHTVYYKQTLKHVIFDVPSYILNLF